MGQVHRPNETSAARPLPPAHPQHKSHNVCASNARFFKKRFGRVKALRNHRHDNDATNYEKGEQHSSDLLFMLDEQGMSGEREVLGDLANTERLVKKNVG